MLLITCICYHHYLFFHFLFIIKYRVLINSSWITEVWLPCLNIFNYYYYYYCEKLSSSESWNCFFFFQKTSSHHCSKVLFWRWQATLYGSAILCKGERALAKIMEKMISKAGISLHLNNQCIRATTGQKNDACIDSYNRPSMQQLKKNVVKHPVKVGFRS